MIHPPGRISLKVASINDTDAITQLLPGRSLMMLNDRRSGQFTIKASSDSNEILSTGRFGLAHSLEELQQHLDVKIPWNGLFPVFTFGHVASLKRAPYDRPLRLIAVLFAELTGATALFSETDDRLGHGTHTRDRFAELIKWCSVPPSSSPPLNWEWDDMLPFGIRPPKELESLRSVHEYVRVMYL